MSGGLVRLRRDGLMAGEVEKFEPYVSNGVLDRLLLDHPLVRITSFVLRRRSFRRAERYRAIEWRGWRVDGDRRGAVDHEHEDGVSTRATR